MAPGYTYQPHERDPNACICGGTSCGGARCQTVREQILLPGGTWQPSYVQWSDGRQWWNRQYG
jgi:hypothetical protein